MSKKQKQPGCPHLADCQWCRTVYDDLEDDYRNLVKWVGGIATMMDTADKKRLGHWADKLRRTRLDRKRGDKEGG